MTQFAYDYIIMELPIREKERLANLGLSLRTNAMLACWQKKVKKSRVRYLCLCELVSTEADYNRDLKLILEKMQVPLRECGAIREEQEKELFPNIRGMMDLSSQLLADVTALKDNWSPHKTMLGNIMIRYSKFLQIYSEFFRSYLRTQARLAELLGLEQVREVQAQLAPNSFENLWSKPFQRPLKYKLLLNSYFKEIYRSHPDYADLTRAIHCYEEVSQRNNKALENKEKSETLLALEARFTGIIDGDSKYYIDQIDAIMMDTRVKCHILSNMLLISTADQPTETEITRIFFDQHSFVVPLKDLLYFKNRLYICGRRRSIHLTFTDKDTRNKCEREVQGIINELYKSEYTRKELSSKGRRTTYLRESIEEVRRSYTQLPEILPRPPRILVLGQLRRRYGCIKTYKIYFVVRFMLPFGEDNCQYLYVDLDDLLALQGIMRTLYPEQLKNVSNIEQQSRTMSAPEMRINSVKSLQYKGIYATIFLNYLFRHPQIVKRTDIIAHRLHVGEPIWIYCRYGHIGCVCEHCSEGGVLANVEIYENELNKRLSNRKAFNTFFCPFRTIHAQNMLAQADLSLIPSAVDRLLFLRCERGRLDYRLVDSTPGSPLRKKVAIQLQRLEGNRVMELMIDPQQRVGQVLQICGRYHHLRMEDYEMFLCVNKNTYVLGRDEVLWQVLENQTSAGDNFFSFFKSAFGEKEDLTFRLYLRKLWVLQASREKANYQKEDQNQVGFLIEEFMLRLRRGEIKLNIEDTSTFYACYFAFQRIGKEGTIAEENLKGLIAPKRWKAMEIQQRAELLGIVRMKVDTLRGKLTNAQILRNIWSYTVRMGENCPGWSAYFFSATVQTHPQYDEGFEVKIGADLQKLYVMSAEKMTTVLQFGLQQTYPMLTFSSWELHIATASFEYIFTGDSLFHLQELINTYLLYRELQG